PVFKAIRDHAAGFDRVAAVSGSEVPFGRGADAKNLAGLFVSASYFPLLGVQPALGRFFRADEDVEPIGAPVVVLSYGFWMRQFGGKSSALGQTLPLGDRPFTVIGVAPRHFTGIDLSGPDIWLPMSSG